MVGTHALREAANRDAFVAEAERIMGTRLRVIPGEEEARLIYTGVAHHAPFKGDGTRLVIDIGGGSTELAWGTGTRPAELLSCKTGCVSLTDACFRSATDQEAAYRAARARAAAALAPLAGRSGGVEVIGTSGTVESVQQVVAANGWGAERITREGLLAVVDAITRGRWLVEAGLPGLAPDRVDIFPAGVAVLDVLFEILDLSSLQWVDASLQQGLLFEQFGPGDPAAELQARTVALLQAKFGVDVLQAQRVRRTALALFDQLSGWWAEPSHWRSLLGWAAELHEVGLAVAAGHYHRHGAYVLRHAHMRGFSRPEQSQLALLVRGHRRSFPGLAFAGLETRSGRELTRLLVLLRLAVILERSHSDRDSPRVAASAAGEGMLLELEAGWLAGHPLSRRELEVEAAQLASAGIRLRVQG
jgi:exopolyphosphatase/guanosine-5'-triphosphate,3'-diphosphate pyrophosphatase